MDEFACPSQSEICSAPMSKAAWCAPYRHIILTKVASNASTFNNRTRSTVDWVLPSSRVYRPMTAADSAAPPPMAARMH